MIRFPPWMVCLALFSCYGPLWGSQPTTSDTAVLPPTTPDRIDEVADEDCITTRDAQVVMQPPHALSVGLQVVRCDTLDGVPPLQYPLNFRVINDETGEPFEAYDEGLIAFAPGPAAEVPTYTVVVLDQSHSVYRGKAVPDVFSTARLVVDELLAENPDDLAHYVTFYEMGAPNRSGFPYPFSPDRAEVLAWLDAIEQGSENLGSTDLYQAHRDTLQLVGAMVSGHPLARRHVVLISDGNHEAGDRENLRSQALERRANHIDDVVVYAVAVGGWAPDPVSLCELATSTEHCLDAADLATLDATFDELDTRLGYLHRSTYGFGICTPVALGNPTLTIEVSVDGGRAATTLPYDAHQLDGSIQDCDPSLWLPSNLPFWPH